MSNLDEIVAMGRLLYEHRLWKEITKKCPPEAIHGQSHLEKANIDISAFVSKFNNECKDYFGTVSNKEKAYKEICDAIAVPFHEYMDEELRENAQKMAEEVLRKYKESK